MLLLCARRPSALRRLRGSQLAPARPIDLQGLSQSVPAEINQMENVVRKKGFCQRPEYFKGVDNGAE